MAGALQRVGVSAGAALALSKAAPIVAVLLTIAASLGLDLSGRGVALVGEVPGGLPSLAVPAVNLELWRQMLVPALLLSLIGYVESVSVGKTLAARRRQSIAPNRELVGLGAANLASAFSGGIPVTGGFSRSAVNFEAGAQTQMASILAAVGIAIAAVFLAPYLGLLPKAVLAATIIVAIFPLIDFHTPAKAWQYSRTDFVAITGTIGVTLLYGVEMGLVFGVLSSLAMHLYKTTHPHIAIVGEVPGTEHFRNIDRHEVVTCPRILTLRVDESLYFANAAFVENRIYAALAENADIEHVILMCPAVNEIDLSALEVLTSINTTLREQHVSFHLSEVKGPVMDSLKRTHFLDELSGNVYLSQHQAIVDLDPEGRRFVAAERQLPADNTEAQP
jgi:SulP family sulfate permease